MHIPKTTTHKLEILTFDDALVHKDILSYDVNKWIYVPDFYSEYRYILGTRGNNPLICIGINPSTAEPNKLDNTLKSVERIALNNKFDSFIMFNVYPQRATNPNDMDLCFNDKLHKENMKAFEYVLSISKVNYIWAAWGNIIEKRPFLFNCVKDMIKVANEYNSKWYSCGKISVKGHPHHPLYLKKDLILDEFNIEAYINNRVV